MALGILEPHSRPTPISAMMVSRSADGGVTWGNADNADPRRRRYVLQRQKHDGLPTRRTPATLRRLGKTAHQWRRPGLLFPHDQRRRQLEAARSIWRPGNTNQPSGNLMIVLRDGSLLNFFTDIIRRRQPVRAVHLCA